MNKKKVFTLCLSVILICVLAFFAYPSKASANEYLNLSKEERISVARAEYSKYSEKPDQKTEVLVTFKHITAGEIIDIIDDNVEIISAFHSFTALGQTAVGGYTDCEGKTVEEVMIDYYDSIYGMLGAAISNYEDNQVSAGKNTPEVNPWVEKMSGEYKRFVLQKEAMEAGGFTITGIRMVAENRVISNLITSEKVYLVEKLDFDNNGIITPMIS